MLYSRQDMTKIIVVGTGNYYKNFLAPSLSLLKKERLAEVLATLSRERGDINKPDFFSRTEHVARTVKEQLSSLFADFQSEKTIIVLSHVNDLHTPDAADLIKHNFKVIIEKPYCINQSQLRVLQGLVRNNPRKIGLLEYYLLMKSSPLLILAGKIKKNSFYFQKKGLLKIYSGLYQFAQDLKNFSGRLKELIGEPKSVLVDLLEGEGMTGRLDHRGPHLSDLRQGGGMIQDLGLHAISPLLVLEDYLGQIDDSFEKGEVRIARCREYLQMARKKFKIPEKYIGETYAEFSFTTAKKIPIRIAVGKYTPDNKNQRRIIIEGSRSRVHLDLNSCTLFLLTEKKSEIKTLEIPKAPEFKYYPVLRATLEALVGRNPFYFDATSAALKAQSFILNVLKKAYSKKDKIPLYPAGALPQNIF